MRAVLFRLGHRRERDKRITTHLFLTARLFKVSEIYYSGDRDEKMEKTIRKLENKWGKVIEKIEYIKDPKKKLQSFKGKCILVHLTMYGLPYKDLVKKIRNEKDKKIVIIVGSEKVPAHIYEISDYNISVGLQPHSELSAFTIFMYELNECRLKDMRINSRLMIVPQERGKKVIYNED